MASRKEEKERLRAERLARESAAQAAQRRKRLVGYGAGAVLAAAAVAAIVVAIGAGLGDGDGASASASEFPAGSVPPAEEADLEVAARQARCELSEDPEEGNTHVEELPDYRANPPSSGDHFAVPAEDGAYTDPPEVGSLIHSLEHGRVIIQFDPPAPDSVKGDLKALYDEDPYHVILVPNATEMPFEVAATAWTRTLGCEEMAPRVFDALRAFRDEFRDAGPEFVP